MTDTATQTAPVATDPAKVKTQVSIMVHVPVELKKLIDDKAGELSTSAAGWLRALAAKQFDYALPVKGVRRPGRFAGMTEEDKKAVLKADRQKNKTTLAAVMAAYAAGTLDLDSILAKYAKQEATEVASAEANGTEQPAAEAAPETAPEQPVQPVS